MLFHINYHFDIHVLRSMRNEKEQYQFCYILIVGFKGVFFGSHQQHQTKRYWVLHRVQSAAKHLGKFTWHGDEVLPLRSLQSGYLTTQFQLSEHFIKAKSSFPRTIVDWIILALGINPIKMKDKIKFGWEFFQAHIVFINIHLVNRIDLTDNWK